MTTTTRQRITIGTVTLAAAVALLAAGSAAGTAGVAVKAPTTTAPAASAAPIPVGLDSYGYSSTADSPGSFPMCDTGVTVVDAQTFAPLDGGDVSAKVQGTGEIYDYEQLASIRAGHLLVNGLPGTGDCADLPKKFDIYMQAAPLGYVAPVTDLHVTISAGSAHQVILLDKGDVHESYLISMVVYQAEKDVRAEKNFAFSVEPPSGPDGHRLRDADSVVHNFKQWGTHASVGGIQAVHGTTWKLHTAHNVISVTLANQTISSDGKKVGGPVVTVDGKKVPVLAFPAQPAAGVTRYATATFSKSGLLTDISVTVA